MVQVTKILFITLNLVSLVIGLATIGTVVYNHTHHSHSSITQCLKLIENPSLIFGCSLVFISVLGFIGSCCRSDWTMLIYLLLVSLLMLGVVAFAFFTSIITGPRLKESSRGSIWLRKHLVDDRHWGSIRSCFVDANVCGRLADGAAHHNIFWKKLSSIQSGCCKPAIECGFNPKKTTVWEVSKSGLTIDNQDCTRWSNNEQKLCYDCHSCKTGVVALIQHQSMTIALFNVVLGLFFAFAYSLGYWTRRNNVKSDVHYSYRAFR